MCKNVVISTTRTLQGFPDNYIVAVKQLTAWQAQLSRRASYQGFHFHSCPSPLLLCSFWIHILQLLLKLSHSISTLFSSLNHVFRNSQHHARLLCFLYFFFLSGFSRSPCNMLLIHDAIMFVNVPSCIGSPFALLIAYTWKTWLHIPRRSQLCQKHLYYSSQDYPTMDSTPATHFELG